MAHPLSWLSGAGLGAAIMFFSDPDRGRRRRALLRDKMAHACTKAANAADVVRRDAANRAVGAIAEMRGRLRRETAFDRVIVARVRARMGRYTTHPSAITASVDDGHVTLHGPILAHEAGALLSAVQGVRGVKSVVSNLDLQNEPNNVAALQGGGRRVGAPIDVLQESWSPTTRFAVGAIGVGLLANCLTQRTPTSSLLGALGFGLTARALTNMSARRSLLRSARLMREQLGSAPTRRSRNQNHRASETNRALTTTAVRGGGEINAGENKRGVEWSEIYSS